MYDALNVHVTHCTYTVICTDKSSPEDSFSMTMTGAGERGRERGLWVSKKENGKDGTKGQ